MPEDTNHLTRRPGDLRPLARLLLGLVLLTGLAVAAPVGTVDAAGSAASPTSEYVPQRVWQMKKNCVWAAGAMLVDKWTHGGIRVSQSVLRRASNDKKGGSSLYDLARGVAAVTGIRMSFSPGYGDTMAWWQLLDRLDHGGGAVLIGEYARLPAHFTRWGRAFANRRNSSHAVYVQTYNRAAGKVWLMDPLAEGHYPGEWINVEDLRRFATVEDGKVMAAATPARHSATSAPLIDHAYRLAGLRLTGRAIAGSTLPVKVSLSIGYGFPAPSAQRFVGRWDPVRPAPPANPVSRTRAIVDTGPAPGTVEQPEPVQAITLSQPDRAGRSGFKADLPVPEIPGIYRLRIGLAEADKKVPSRSFKTITVEVLQPYAGNIALPKAAEATVGAGLRVHVAVGNIGTVDWRPPPPDSDDPPPVAPVTTTLLTLVWRAADGSELPAARLPIALAPGQGARLDLDLVAPDSAGQWTLVPDVVNVERGALSSTGRSLPTMAVTVDPRGLSSEP